MGTKAVVRWVTLAIAATAIACSGSDGGGGAAGMASTVGSITGASGQVASLGGTGGVSSAKPASTGGMAAPPPATAGTHAATGGSIAPAATGGAMSTAGAPAAGTAGGIAGSVAKPSGGKIPVHGPDPTDSLQGTTMGPYKVMMYSSGYPQATEYADSTIYAPDAEPPLASVAVVPGFVSPQSSIQNWGPFLASWGIATITIGTNSPTDTPDVREVALIGALKTLRDENTRSGSPLMGKLATDVQATMGWSMGGGGTLLAANDHPDQVKVTISMCAWNPGFQYTMIKSPALMFASQGDPLAGGQSQGFYMSVPDSTPKMLIETPGGDHFVANDPAGQQGMIGRFGLSWMKVYLEQDDRFHKFLLQKPAVMTTDFQTNVK